MKTDKELLELAARAAGINGTIIETPSPYISCVEGECGTYRKYMWTPLTDDGDALRLASVLNLIVDTAYDRAIEAARLIKGHNDWVYGESDFDNDDLTSTRRAIVRAAAAIGERL